jgi:hypothetical protein
MKANLFYKTIEIISMIDINFNLIYRFKVSINLSKISYASDIKNPMCYLCVPMILMW